MAHADALVAAFADSSRHNRDPGDYLTPRLTRTLAAARRGDGAARRRADALLAQGFIAWARDLDTPRGVNPVVTDPAAVTPFDPDATLAAAVRAPDMSAHLAALQTRHPLYEALSSALAGAIAKGEDVRLHAANLERARTLPAAPAGRHIVVDAAGARLWMFEGRRLAGTMKTVVGRPDMPTPLMSGMIRHVVTRPYWNIPEDIVQNSIAPAVLRAGAPEVRRRDLEILADWSPAAKPLDPATVDWAAVARGELPLRVRQRPGPGNMMGRIKFMLPNDLGIYLHDTPKRADFARAARFRSSGCVRVEDAPRLAAWLFDGASPLAKPGRDRTTPLPTPVPVHISYFTLAPKSDELQADGLRRNRDVYRRDEAAMVRAVGLEPTLLAERDFESRASTSFTTPARSMP